MLLAALAAALRLSISSGRDCSSARERTKSSTINGLPLAGLPTPLGHRNLNDAFNTMRRRKYGRIFETCPLTRESAWGQLQRFQAARGKVRFPQERKRPADVIGNAR